SSWGFEALLYPLYAVLGIHGLYLWRWVATLAALALMMLGASSLGARRSVALVAAMIAVVAMSSRMQPRPETLAQLLLLLCLWILLRRRWQNRDATFALPLVSLTWINVHLSWFLGPFLIALFAAEETWRARTDRSLRPARLWIVLGACLAVSLVNPFGIRAMG